MRRWVPRWHAIQQLHEPAKGDAAVLAVIIGGGGANATNVRQRVEADADVVHRQDPLQLTEADEAGAVAVVAQKSFSEIGRTPALLHLLPQVFHQLFAAKIHVGRGTWRGVAKWTGLRE